MNSFEETLKDGLEAIKEQYFTIPNRGIPRKSDKINLHNQEEFASMLYCRELLKLVQGNLEEIPGYSFLQKKARDSTIMIIENTLDNGKSRGGWER